MQVPQPSVVEGTSEIVQLRFAPHVSGLGPGDREFGSCEFPSRFFLPPLVNPGDVSSAFSSGYLRVDDKSRDGNLDQSATLNGGALSAPMGNCRVIRKQVRHMVVQTDPPPKPRKPCTIKQKRRRRLELEAGLKSFRWFYDPLGTWPTSAAGPAWTGQCLDIFLGEQGLGIREVACGPFLYMNQRRSGGYRWIDTCVQEEPIVCSFAVSPAVRSPVVRSVVVFLGGARGSASCRSTPVKVGPPIVAHALDDVPGGRDHRNKCYDLKRLNQIEGVDDTLVPFYGYLGNGRQLHPPNARLYNKCVGGKPREDLRDVAKPIPLRARNIRIGKPLILEGLHIGGVSRFKARTFVQNIRGRKTDTILQLCV